MDVSGSRRRSYKIFRQNKHTHAPLRLFKTLPLQYNGSKTLHISECVLKHKGSCQIIAPFASFNAIKTGHPSLRIPTLHPRSVLGRWEFRWKMSGFAAKIHHPVTLGLMEKKSMKRLLSKVCVNIAGGCLAFGPR